MTGETFGNLLCERPIESALDVDFCQFPEFGTGGEDIDFFQRMVARGHVFVWCNEAVVYETVPPSRWTRRYMISRALLRGRNNLRLKDARVRLLAASCVAVPVYSLVLPFAILFGQHVFMRYAIRFCDHFGRLLAVVRLNPVGERQM